MTADNAFDRATLELALRELGRRAYAAGKVVEIAIYGGCAVMLTLNHRVAAKDVDAVFEKDKDFVRKIAAEVAEEFDWDKDWLNDGVKGWLSAVENHPAAKVFIGTYPSEEQPGLRVFVPKPEYLFAMKCRAMRVGGTAGSQDIEDIRRLAKALGIETAQQAMDLVQAFQARPKTRFGLEEIFSKHGDS